MPIAKVSRFERPRDALPGQARRNMRAVEKVMLVIEADELMRRDGPVAESGDGSEQSTDARCAR
jgi:hypothetical protein